MATREGTRATIWASSVAELREDAAHLVRAHLVETCPGSNGVDWAAYAAMEETGSLSCFAAKVDGLTVGYAVLTVMPDWNDMGRMKGDVVAWYVDPEWRGVGIGGRLCRRCEAVATSRGCSRCAMWVPVKPDRAWGCSEHMGFDVDFVRLSKDVA